MGTWDADSFGNIPPATGPTVWRRSRTLRYVEQTLDRVLACGRNQSVPAEAAECAVAAGGGGPTQGQLGESRTSYSETTDKWVRSHRLTPPPALVAKTVAALDRIVVVPSDLLDLCRKDKTTADGWTLSPS